MNPTDYYTTQILYTIPKGLPRDVFNYLLRNSDRMVTKDELIPAVFGEPEDPTDKNKPKDRKVRQVVEDLNLVSDVNIWTTPDEAGYYFATRPNDTVYEKHIADKRSRVAKMNDKITMSEANNARLKERARHGAPQPQSARIDRITYEPEPEPVQLALIPMPTVSRYA